MGWGYDLLVFCMGLSPDSGDLLLEMLIYLPTEVRLLENGTYLYFFSRVELRYLPISENWLLYTFNILVIKWKTAFLLNKHSDSLLSTEAVDVSIVLLVFTETKEKSLFILKKI